MEMFDSLKQVGLLIQEMSRYFAILYVLCAAATTQVYAKVFFSQVPAIF